MKTIEHSLKIKWCISKYGITENNRIFNLKTNRELKEVRKNYSIGYLIDRKFKSLKYIRENCKPYKDKFCPF